MTKQQEVLQILEKNRLSIKKFGVKRIGLFGSFARDEAGPSSDVDILVDLEKKTFRSYMGLKFFLEEIFGRRVDLVLTESIKPRLRETILHETVYAAGL